MHLKNLLKYGIRFAFLQGLLTLITISYFDRFLVPNKEIKESMYLKVLEDLERFFPFIKKRVKF